MAIFQLRRSDSDDDYQRVQAAVDAAALVPSAGGVLVTRSVDGSIREAVQTSTVPRDEVHERQLES
jgi:hypothetical protein